MDVFRAFTAAWKWLITNLPYFPCTKREADEILMRGDYSVTKHRPKKACRHTNTKSIPPDEGGNLFECNNCKMRF